MEQSLYYNYTEKVFPKLVVQVIEKLNDKRQSTLSYMYKDLLDVEYSADGRWSSVLAEYSRVAADVVSMDSELPLKSRDSIETATGDIPKMGLKLYLTEKQMKDIQSMIAQNMPITQILRKIFNDVPRVIEAIYERIEDLFLSELSTGVGVSSRNNGTGVRIDVGYYSGNKFTATTDWTTSAGTPLTEIQALVDKSIDDQNTLMHCYADDTALNKLYKNQQIRSQFAFDTGTTVVNGSTVPVLDFDKLAAVFQKKWGVTLHRVSRKIKTEINGTKQNHSPWASGMIAFTCDDKLGSLVWTDTVESGRRVAGVQYQTADQFILVSKYSKNDPLQEFTASQAMVVPIINNVDRIYTFNSAAPVLDEG